MGTFEGGGDRNYFGNLQEGGGSEIINPWRRVGIIILRHTGVGMGVGWSEFSFHKKCLSFCGGSSTFLSPIWRGVERGVEKISDETGRVRKILMTQIKTYPTPTPHPPHPRLLWDHRNMFKTGVVRAYVC